MRLVLASQSPRRRELLAALVNDFDVAPADIDEPLGDDGVADALALARAKAEHVARTHPEAMVIAADTVVFDERRLYGKPENTVEAAEMLEALQGRDHRVATGIAVTAGGEVSVDASVATVTLSVLNDSEIRRYIESGVPMDKAGAYAIQDEQWPVVASMSGCYCNVVGLPLWRLKRLLESGGVACRPPDATFARCAGCPDR